MTSLYQFKPAFQSLLRPIVGLLARRKVTPNQVTWAALSMSVCAGAAIAWWPGNRFVLLLIPLVMLFRMALNAIDGMLAREHRMQTVAGGFLNELSDVIADAALCLPFALVLPQYGAWVIALVVMALIAEFAGVLAQALGGSRRYDGPMGKSDRAFVVGLLALLLGSGVPAGAWCAAMLGTAFALVTLTVWNRVRNGIDEVSRMS